MICFGFLRAMRRFLLHSFFAACGAMTGCGPPRPSFEQLLDEGMHEYRRGNYAEAVGMFKGAAELDRERPEPSYWSGECYMAMAARQFKEDDLPGALRYCDRAVDAFDRAVAAFPGFAKALQGKSDAERLSGRNRAALDVANWAAAYVGPQAKMLVFKGRQYAQAGDIDQAQLSFRQAVSVEPENPAAHAELGLFYLRCGNDAEAIKSLQRAYELKPGDPGVLAALARLGAAPPPGQ